MHVDAHITLPWYLSLEEAHDEVDAVEKLVVKHADAEMEFFIHADPCLPISCPICSKKDCKVRKADFVKRLEWTKENMLPDTKHTIK